MIFMHKDKPIAEVSVNSGRFSVYKLLSNQELPVGTMTQTRQLLELSLSNWYSSRQYPACGNHLTGSNGLLGVVRSMHWCVPWASASRTATGSGRTEWSH